MKFRTLIIMLCAFALSACDDGETDTQETCGGEICAESQVCFEEQCVDTDEFCGDIICSDTQDCVDDQCVDTDKLCGDVVCQSDEICSDTNKCIPAKDSCGGKLCDADSICIDEVCTLKTDLCGNVICSDTQSCIDEKCIDNSELCGSSICSEDEVCVDLTCEIIIDRCKTKDDCLDGWSCNTTSGKCEKNTSECGSCEAWQACNPYTLKCIPAYGHCGDNDDCPYTDQSCNLDTHLCEGGKLEEPEGNIVLNWDFEEWTGSIPSHWTVETNYGGDFVVKKESSNPRSGEHAAKIKNTAKSNGRLISDPFKLETGKYSCSAWAIGHGEVKLGVRLTDNDGKAVYQYKKTANLYGTSTYANYEFNFSIGEDNETAEIIVAVKETENGYVIVDAISCARLSNKCDDVTCNEWEFCDQRGGLCKISYGRCNEEADCTVAYRECNTETHTCEIKAGHCQSIEDCNSTLETPKNCVNNSCIDEDPCTSVTCVDYKSCNVENGKCELNDGQCVTSKDCLQDKPACDVSTHTCEAAEHECNIFPDGGFESWNVYELPYQDETLIPDGWFGYFGDLNDDKYYTELKAKNIAQYTTSTHSGNYAMQITFTKRPAERLASIAFDVPVGDYTCSYWVRGKGGIRHRTYSTAGESPYTDFVSIDSLDWQRIPFAIRSNARHMRLILYVSDTDASKDHIQIDDVVCTKN